MSVPVHKTRTRRIAVGRVASLLTVAVGLVACDGNRPRTYEFFMEDGLARDGVLARCNQDPHATAGDVECENARRAAATLAAAGEKERNASLAKQSERRLSAMRDREVREDQAVQDAAAAEKAEADAGDRFERESLSQLPARRELKLAAVTPPQSDIQPQKPEIDHAAIIPRPFRADSAPK